MTIRVHGFVGFEKIRPKHSFNQLKIGLLRDFEGSFVKSRLVIIAWRGWKRIFPRIQPLAIINL